MNTELAYGTHPSDLKLVPPTQRVRVG